MHPDGPGDADVLRVQQLGRIVVAHVQRQMFHAVRLVPAHHPATGI
jgi:hypothetical protein